MVIVIATLALIVLACYSCLCISGKISDQEEKNMWKFQEDKPMYEIVIKNRITGKKKSLKVEATSMTEATLIAKPMVAKEPDPDNWCVIGGKLIEV